MKKIISLVFLSLTSLMLILAVSCNEDIEPQLDIDVTTISFDAVANSVDSIVITSNTSWTAKSSESWLSIDPESGINDGVIVVSAEQNKDTVSRTSTVTVSATELESQTITITQGGALAVSAKILYLKAEDNSSNTFYITSDTSWTVTSTESWLTVSPSSGTNNAEVTITAEQNADTEARRTMLTVRENGSEPIEVEVAQAGTVYKLSVSTTSISIGSDANSTGIFTITSNAPWSLTSSESWLSVSPSSGDSDTEITVVAEATTVGSQRTASVKITTEFTTSKTVWVKQDGLPCGDDAEIPCVADGCLVPEMPSYASLQDNPYLPDPFTFMDGTRMTTKEEWTCRRAEIAMLAQEFEYGYKPCTPYEATTGSFSGNTVTVTVTLDGKTISFDCPITYPSTGTAPYPAMIGFGYSSLDNALLLELGVALISFPNDAIGNQANQSSRGKGKFFELYCSEQSSGAIMSWSWGISRLVDALEKTPEANIDATHLGVTGCSRNGKGALAAGAFDERIALTVPQESGSGGAANWRVSDFQGSSVQRLQQIVGENVWFRENFSQFRYTANKLPFDHHMIAALCAPRGLLIIENTSQVWLGDLSCWTTGNAAHMVWEALGVPENMGFSQVGDHNHCAFPASQQPELRAYVKKFLLDDDSEDTTIIYTDGDLVFDIEKWINWSVPELQ
ncbi:MAG: BACON domain-containing protein [Prolixibacteraceae bacterium]|jgi:hypothetical protein|nr:BACON domain-containing protein [Prolixibacteraceae bacterium]